MESIRRLLGQRGFSMIEMLVIMGIIAIIIGGGIRLFQGIVYQSRIGRAKGDLIRIQSGLEVFYAENGCYPSVMTSTGETYPLDMALAGMAPGFVVPKESPDAAPYRYDPDNSDEYYPQSYALMTSDRLDRVNYVKATGDGGQPAQPVLATE